VTHFNVAVKFICESQKTLPTTRHHDDGPKTTQSQEKKGKCHDPKPGTTTPAPDMSKNVVIAAEKAKKPRNQRKWEANHPLKFIKKSMS
jgi:hypothetical protein